MRSLTHEHVQVTMWRHIGSTNNKAMQLFTYSYVISAFCIPELKLL
jgi:hypothetical protein